MWWRSRRRTATRWRRAGSRRSRQETSAPRLRRHCRQRSRVGRHRGFHEPDCGGKLGGKIRVAEAADLGELPTLPTRDWPFRSRFLLAGSKRFDLRIHNRTPESAFRYAPAHLGPTRPPTRSLHRRRRDEEIGSARESRRCSWPSSLPASQAPPCPARRRFAPMPDKPEEFSISRVAKKPFKQA